MENHEKALHDVLLSLDGRIAGAIYEHEPLVTAREIALSIHCTERTVLISLSRLEKAGIVLSTHVGRGTAKTISGDTVRFFNAYFGRKHRYGSLPSPSRTVRKPARKNDSSS